VDDKKEAARQFLYSYNLELVGPARMYGVNYFAYEHPMWWWELVSFAMKALLTGFITVVADPNEQLAIAMTVLLVAIFLQALFNPYKRDSTDVIASIVLLEILLSLFLALMIVQETGVTGLYTDTAARRAAEFGQLFIWSNVAVIGMQVLLLLLESVVDGQQAESELFKKRAAVVEKRHVATNTIVEEPSTEEESSDTPPPPPEVKIDLTWNRRDVKWKRLRTLQMGIVHTSNFPLPNRLMKS